MLRGLGGGMGHASASKQVQYIYSTMHNSLHSTSCGKGWKPLVGRPGTSTRTKGGLVDSKGHVTGQLVILDLLDLLDLLDDIL